MEWERKKLEDKIVRLMEERDEARGVARELWAWVQNVEPDGVDHPGNWEGPYPWLKRTLEALGDE